mgnify:CR=1 FL=1
MANKIAKISQISMTKSIARKPTSSEVEDTAADDLKEEDSEENYSETERQSECPPYLVSLSKCTLRRYQSGC